LRGDEHDLPARTDIAEIPTQELFRFFGCRVLEHMGKQEAVKEPWVE
jgi:hypothetical protein